MSIFTNSLPSLIQPVYNTAYSNIGSTQSGAFNFHYVYDLYVQSAITTSTFTNAYYGRYPLLPRYPQQNCLFSPNRIIESSLSYDLTHNLVCASASTNCARYFQVSIGEQTGSVVLTGVGFYSGYVINAVVQYEELTSWNSGNTWRNYWMTGATSQFLTNQPLSVYIRDDERASISYLNYGNIAGSAGVGSPKYIRLERYQYSGGTKVSLIHSTGNFSPTATATTTNANYLVNHFGCGIWNLNQIPANAIFLNAFVPLVNPDTDYKYEIALLNQISNLSSEIRTFVIDNRCTKYHPIRFMFLNSLGAFDYFTALLLSRDFIDVNKKTFKKFLPVNYPVGSRGQTTFDITAVKSTSISTDWVSDAESRWLQEFFTSTEVYELLDDGTILPITVDNKSIEIKKLVNDKLINYEFNYTYAFEVATQRS